MIMIYQYRSILLIICGLCFLFYFLITYGGSGMYLLSANATSTSFSHKINNYASTDTQIKKCDVTSYSTYKVNVTGEAYPINYQITGAKLNNISAPLANATLLVNISPISDGILTIELPRNLIDSKKQGSIDDRYTILDDGRHTIPSREIKNNKQVRTLEIHFDKTAKYINVVGNKMEVVLTTNYRQTQVYSPQLSITCLDEKPPSESAVQIIANVTDEFGKIQDANLYYSIGCSSISCQNADWQHKNMNLIWGNLSNGTFSTTIPAVLQGNTTVNYYVSVKDDLGYSSTTKIMKFVTKTGHTNQPVMAGWYYDVLLNGSSILEAEIVD